MDIRYIGHSAFQFKAGDTAILVDPYVSVNPDYKWQDENVTDIFVTHGHSDHLGSAIEISKEKKAPITAMFEVANYCSKHGATVNGVNMGGWLEYPWGRAVFVPAFHSSALPDGSYGGMPTGIVFEIEGVRIYHAGDTSLSAEMKTIKELYNPTIALLPIGGHYTMDVDHAAIAVQWLGVKTVIPMHYGTFPEIKADLERFMKLIEQNNTSCMILNPDELS